MTNEIRKDYLIDQWVIIASERAKRPTDFKRKDAKKNETKIEDCPFCPGNEMMTPPASLLYLPDNGGIKKDKDHTGERRRDWLVRCVPNLYPALSPRVPIKLDTNLTLTRRDGVGAHEVIIESPDHNKELHELSIEHVQDVLWAYKERILDLKKEIQDFIIARNWEKYHNPKDLAVSISIEASELLELFQWMNQKEVENSVRDGIKMDKIRKDLADIVIYCLSCANILNIDVSKAVHEKIEENNRNYPVDMVRNKYRKYTEIF